MASPPVTAPHRQAGRDTAPAWRPGRAGVLLGCLAALVAALVGTAFAGTAAPSALVDPGAVVRWGLPVLTVLTELAASVAVGALVLAAAVLPRGTGRASSDGAAWPATVATAAGAAGAWAVLSLGHLVLRYGSVAGTPPSSPTFGTELSLFVTAVPLGRSLLTITVVAAVTCVVALLVTTPRGALLTALLAGTALALQAQTGHASGSTSHDLAVTSMFLHLAGAALWVGGLAALALVAHRLGRDLGPAVARFSPIAAWCFVAVGLSGVVNSALRLGGPDGLATPYGALVVAKTLLFVALGLLGWLHRRSAIPRLVAVGGTDAARTDDVAADDAPAAAGTATGAAPRRRAPWLFWRVVAVELAVMGAVSGVAVALGSTAPPVPQDPSGERTPAEIVTGHPLPPPPTVELWLTSFRWDLLTASGCVAGLVVYLRWVRRLRVRGDRWPWGRTVCAVAGLTTLLWTTSGGPAVYGHVLFSAHMIQHMILVMLVPILLALAAPVTLAARALPVRRDGSRGPREWLLAVVHSRPARFLAHPVVAAVNFAGSMVVFYYTPAFELALTTTLGHLLMIVHFTVAGYLFVNALIGVDPGPTRPSFPGRLLLLFSTMAFHAFFGVALVTQETLLAPEWFGLLGRPWGPSALEDQRDGGAVAWGISELPMLVIAIAIAVAWTRDDERTARRRDRAADRDGGAELAQYNAMLARMAATGPGDDARREPAGAAPDGSAAAGAPAPGSPTRLE